MVLNDNKKELVMQHVEQLQTTFPELQLKKQEDDRFIVAGNLSFSVSHNGKVIRDDYDIEIFIPGDYPQNPPTVKEIGNKIPQDKDNHINSKDETLCLGAPLDVKRTFAQKRNLSWFVKEQVVRFLFSYSYKQKYGVMPFGELAHGTEGLLEYYKELFSVQDNWHVLGLLKILADDNYKGHTPCPCNSGRRLRDCHGNFLREIRKYQKPDNFLEEHLKIFNFLDVGEDSKNTRAYLPKKVLKEIKKRRKIKPKRQKR